MDLKNKNNETNTPAPIAISRHLTPTLVIIQATTIIDVAAVGI